jgi:hypothetical protein
MNEDEQRGREIQTAIARVLMEEWDPIGVRDEPQAAGEYDMYVGGIYRLLATGASPDQIAKHLAAIERDRMGFERSHAGMVRDVAEKLARIDVRLRPPRPAI